MDLKTSFFIVFLLFVSCGYFMSNPFIVYLLKKYICLKFEDELKLVFVFERVLASIINISFLGKQFEGNYMINIHKT